jgi:hypothetical protein
MLVVTIINKLKNLKKITKKLILKKTQYLKIKEKGKILTIKIIKMVN